LIPVDCCWGAGRRVGSGRRWECTTTCFRTFVKQCKQQLARLSISQLYNSHRPPNEIQQSTRLDQRWSRHSRNVFVFVFHNDTSGLLCKFFLPIALQVSPCPVVAHPLCHSSTPLSSHSAHQALPKSAHQAPSSSLKQGLGTRKSKLGAHNVRASRW